jgi:hypothetical protein
MMPISSTVLLGRTLLFDTDALAHIRHEASLDGRVIFPESQRGA